MKTLFQVLSFAALLTLSACGAGADPAVGTWKLDKDATEPHFMAMLGEQMANAPAEMQDMMKQMLRSMEASMELKADGTAQIMTTTPAGPMGGQPEVKNESGTWKNDNGTITMTKEGEADPASGSLDGDTLTLKIAENGKTMTMVFARQK